MAFELGIYHFGELSPDPTTYEVPTPAVRLRELRSRRNMAGSESSSEERLPGEGSEVMGEGDRMDSDDVGGADRMDSDDVGGADMTDPDIMGS